jgi:predicted nucleic acid-binding protein
MTKYVVDASIIIKWVVGDEKEVDQGKALGLLQMWTDSVFDLAACGLWQYEVGNFLGRELLAEAADKMNLLRDLNISTLELSGQIIERCFQIMRDYKVTFYDATYLAFAFEIDGTLITADESFARKTKATNRVSVLKDLQTRQKDSCCPVWPSCLLFQ